MKTLMSAMIVVLCGQVALAQEGLPDDVRRALPAGSAPEAKPRPAAALAAKPAPAPAAASAASDESLDQQRDEALFRYLNIAAQGNDGRWEAEVLERLNRLAAAANAQQAQMLQATKDSTTTRPPATAAPGAVVPASGDLEGAAPAARPAAPPASAPAAPPSLLPSPHDPAVPAVPPSPSGPAPVPAAPALPGPGPVPPGLTPVSPAVVASKPVERSAAVTAFYSSSAQQQAESLEALAGCCEELAGRLRQTAVGLRKQQTASRE